MEISDLGRRVPPTLAPPGTVIDYDSKDDIGNRLIIASWITLIAALLAVTGRLIGRTILLKASLGLDDWFAIFAFLFAIARNGCNSWEVWRAGVGRHVWDIRPKYYHPILNVYEIGNVVYLFGIMCAKFSFLFLYLHLFGKVHPRFRWACYTVGFIVGGYCISCALATLFACRPEAATWNRNIDGKCIDLIVLDITVGALNIFTDTLILILPIPLLLRLQASWKRKIELLAVFGTGLFVIATAIVRVVIVIKTLRDFDQTRAIIPDMIWLTVELNVGIVCCCLPLMRPLVHRLVSTNLASSFKESMSRLLPKNYSSDTMASPDSNTAGPYKDKVKPAYPDSSVGFVSENSITRHEIPQAKNNNTSHSNVTEARGESWLV